MTADDGSLCFASPPQHAWGPTERKERPMGGDVWHWCRCQRCGAHGFKVETEMGVSGVTRCWKPCAKQITIGRDGSMVLIEIKCASDYDAMMLEDRMTEEMRSGYVKLEIMTRPKPEAA